MVRCFLTLLLLAAVAGCGGAPTSHRVERTQGSEAAPAARTDAVTRPPRAIATH